MADHRNLRLVSVVSVSAKVSALRTWCVPWAPPLVTPPPLVLEPPWVRSARLFPGLALPMRWTPSCAAVRTAERRRDRHQGPTAAVVVVRLSLAMRAVGRLYREPRGHLQLRGGGLAERQDNLAHDLAFVLGQAEEGQIEEHTSELQSPL